MKVVDLEDIPDTYPTELRAAIHSLVFKYNEAELKEQYLESVILALRTHSINFNDYFSQSNLEISQ